MKGSWQIALAVMAAALLAPVSARAIDTPMPTNVGALPLILKGAQLPALLGEGAHKLSAFTCREGRPQPVLFQMDDVNSEGRFAPPDAKDRIAPDEKPGFLDETDEIAVMMKDLGEACSAEQLGRVHGKLAAVTVSVSYLEKPATLYILAAERGFVPQGSYVRYDAKTDTVTGSTYFWGYVAGRPFDYDRMGFSTLQGRVWEDVFDRLKVRAYATTVGKLLKLRVTEEDIQSTLDAVRVGPIRVVRELSVEVNVIPGLTLHALVTFIHYEELWRAAIRLKMNQVAALFTSSMDVVLDHDFTNLSGVTFSTSALPQGALVDGRMIESERNIIFGPEPWYMLSGQGLNQIVAVELDPGLDLTAAAGFVDSATERDEPEEFPGSLPSGSYKFLGWEHLKAQWYSFGANIVALPRFPERGGSGFYRALHAPVEVKVE